MRVLASFVFNKSLLPSSFFSLTPFFNSATQIRWRKKPVSTAQTRLETRTLDLKLDRLTAHLNKLNQILHLHFLFSTKKRGPFVSLQLISSWNHLVGLNISAGAFIRKYPHIFQVFTHPIKRNLCVKITQKFMGLLREEENVVKDMELENVDKLKKILLLSVNGSVHIHALRLIRRELGLPPDFRDSILGKHSECFRLVDLEVVALVDRGDEGMLSVAKIEKWREEEYREKWLSEFETKFAFPVSYPTGFRIQAGGREKLRNWQRMPYVKAYEREKVVRGRTKGEIDRFEKRVVGVLHELLSLTVGKIVEVERLVHFRKDLGIEVNIRELLLKHPGIFYISTRGSNPLVFLREAYSGGCLVETNGVYDVRRKMLDLVLLGCRNTRELLRIQEEGIEEDEAVCNESERVRRGDGDFVLSILESSNGNKPSSDVSDLDDSSE